MRIIEMPDCAYRNAVINAAAKVMSECSDISHMLQQADMFLTHDFKWAKDKAEDKTASDITE